MVLHRDRFSAASQFRRVQVEAYCGWRSCATTNCSGPLHTSRSDRQSSPRNARYACVVLQISDVLAHKRLPINDQRYRVFEIRTQGKDRPLARQHSNRPRRISARTPQNHRPKDSIAHHRILHSPRNGPFANQKCISNPLQVSLCASVILKSNRLARTIRARHHQHSPARPPQTANDAAAYTAASLRGRDCPVPPRVPSRRARCNTIGRALDVSNSSASRDKSTRPRADFQISPPSPQTAFLCGISAPAAPSPLPAFPASHAR